MIERAFDYMLGRWPAWAVVLVNGALQLVAAGLLLFGVLVLQHIAASIIAGQVGGNADKVYDVINAAVCGFAFGWLVGGVATRWVDDWFKDHVIRSGAREIYADIAAKGGIPAGMEARALRIITEKLRARLYGKGKGNA